MAGQGDKKLIRVETKSSAYDVVIGSGLIDELDKCAARALEQTSKNNIDSIFVVSDSQVWNFYEKRAVASLSRLGVRVNSFIFEAGEKSKTPQTLFECVQKMAEAGCTRDSLVVTLGGGVACDLGGFAAATYMRGVRLMAVPTSLLAMVDASVGGKTAVDLPAGKNLFGAFHQPIAVIIDARVLATLNDAEFKDSVGEVVKHSILGDREMFDFLSKNKLDKTFVGTEALENIIFKNVEIKKNIVSADEKESGERQTLNLGHTIGHAIETASNYQLGHGSCVACGLCVLARALAKNGRIDSNVAAKIIAAYETQELPTTTQVSANEIFKLVRNDKKRHGDGVNLIVPYDIGKCEVVKFSFSELEKLLSDSTEEE